MGALWVCGVSGFRSAQTSLKAAAILEYYNHKRIIKLLIIREKHHFCQEKSTRAGARIHRSGLLNAGCSQRQSRGLCIPFARRRRGLRHVETGWRSGRFQSVSCTLLACGGSLQQSFPSTLQVAVSLEGVLKRIRHGKSPLSRVNLNAYRQYLFRSAPSYSGGRRRCDPEIPAWRLVHSTPIID